MKIKLIFGDYVYLYHDVQDLNCIDKYIKERITKLQYKIKWKDEDNEMITIFRPQDLKYCVDATEKLNQTLRLYIQEFLPNFPQLNQKQQFQQSMLQSNCQQVHASNLIGIENLKLTKEMTFAQQQQSQEYPVKEEKQFFQYTVRDAIQQVYPGLEIDLEDINDMVKSSQIQESQSISFGQQIQRQESRSNTQKMTPSFNEQQIQDNINEDDNKQNEALKQSLHQIDNNLGDPLVQNEYNEGPFYCDYCSELIQNKVCFQCKCPECSDMHFCENCFNNNDVQADIQDYLGKNHEIVR
ncbi:unnamed protein product [Paramecium sonneborni]|uniref:Uncharacterized protein n=1 Tax=Paramecium sonneborni TaxID=65129 RepID=A0A8S1NLE5_9CILI|nr:unnamed protein product [Paramecium sonneborni]